MRKSSDPNDEPAVVKDAFEIKPQHNTGHDTGVVAVLNRLITESPEELVGLIALVCTPAGKSFRVNVDDARYHGTTNSLFFKSLTTVDVPVGSTVALLNQSL